jgi:hypothetical protein
MSQEESTEKRSPRCKDRLRMRMTTSSPVFSILESRPPHEQYVPTACWAHLTTHSCHVGWASCCGTAELPTTTVCPVFCLSLIFPSSGCLGPHYYTTLAPKSRALARAPLSPPIKKPPLVSLGAATSPLLALEQARHSSCCHRSIGTSPRRRPLRRRRLPQPTPLLCTNVQFMEWHVDAPFLPANDQMVEVTRTIDGKVELLTERLACPCSAYVLGEHSLIRVHRCAAVDDVRPPVR